MKLKPLRDQVIVVTGASSGIGLATATMAAGRGAKVVLVARSAGSLATAVERIEAAGGDALSIVADVGSADDLRSVARAAVACFGRIDTWINNAGVGILGTVMQTDERDMRRLFETNFWGVVHGSRVAVPYLARQGGALINVGSLESDRAVPLQGIYSASKHAVKGFTDALRDELRHRKAPISVTLIKPGAIGTPLMQHLKDLGSREARLPPPIYAPEDAAATILDAATHPTRDAYVGGFASASAKFADLFPRLVDWIDSKALVHLQHGRGPATPTDNLHAGRSEAVVRGDPQGLKIHRSLYDRLRRHGDVAMAIGAVALAAAWAGRSRTSRR